MTDPDQTAPDPTDAGLAAARERYQAGRAKRLRADGMAQYTDIEGDFAGYDRDPFADPDFSRDPIRTDVEVLIVGGGLTAQRTRH